MRRVIMTISLTIIVSSVMIAQVPIDLSKAREFQVIWKKAVSGRAGVPKVVISPCSVNGMSMLMVGSPGGGFSCYTEPRIDTQRVVEGWGNAYIPIDYDGIPPLEYLNDNGKIDSCRSTVFPFQLERSVDTIACWGGQYTFINFAFSADVDADGYQDLVCDIGGGGYTAQVIRGGPNAGKGCHRILTIPKPPGRNKRNSTKAFWKSASGVWRLLRNERDSNALSPWMMLYEVRIGRSFGAWRIDFVKTDSLYGDGMSLSDEPFGEAAVVVDTVARQDWLLMQRRIRVGNTVFPLERFDATNGRFTPTGEQVTGVEFYEPWVAGYSLGTSQPVIAFHASGVGRVFCYANDIAHPFARWNPQGALSPPIPGMIAINDQTGDGRPDLVAASGSTNGGVALYTLDSAFVTHTPSDEATQPETCRMEESRLILDANSHEDVTIEIISSDGRVVETIAGLKVTPGTNRFDLSATLHHLARGVYVLRARSVSMMQTLRFIR